MSRRQSAEPNELVFALCHEIGNLLAATRMHTHLLDSDSSPDEINNAVATVSELSSRIGSMLAQIRPLLSAPPVNPPHIDPLDVLDGLQRGLEAGNEARVRFDLKSAVDLPHAAIDPDPLHHVLMLAIYHSLEESDGLVRVGAASGEAGVIFSVTDEVAYEEGRGGAALRGRDLASRVAERVVGARGGQVRVVPADGGTRFEVAVPRAPE